MPREGFVMRKPNHRNVLNRVDMNIHNHIVDWMVKGLFSYDEIVEKLAKEYEVFTSADALKRFYQKNVWPTVVLRRQQSVDLALNYNKEILKNPADFYVPTLDALSNRAMKIAMDDKTTAKELKMVVDTLVRLREQSVKEMKLEVYMRHVKSIERKAKAAEDLAKNGKLTQEETVERFRAIFNRETKQLHNGETKTENPENGPATQTEKRFQYGVSS